MKRRLTPMGEGGSLALEFALVFPVFITLVLMLIQWVLLVNARVVVSYAVYCAARSAVVTIPTVLGSEEANRLGEEKEREIAAAAAIACLPISPRIGSFAGDFSADLQIMALRGDPYRTNALLRMRETEPLPSGEEQRLLEELMNNPLVGSQVRQTLEDARGAVLSSLGELAGTAADLIGGIRNLLPQEVGWLLEKYVYSKLFTNVDIADGPVFGANQQVTVTVTYPFYLNIPFARRVLGERMGRSYYDRWLVENGDLDESLRLFLGSVLDKTRMYYVNIQERCTMMNEGEDVNLPN